MNIRNKNGWLFDNPEKNEIHYINNNDIDQLLVLAQEEDSWSEYIRNQVVLRDKRLKSDKNLKSISNILLDEILMHNAEGTVVRYPFHLSTITFRSRRHLFRGEPAIYSKSIPLLNRKLIGKTSKEKLFWKALADLRISQFENFLLKLNVVPYWIAKLSDINYKALAQHYGFDTHLLDLTNDVKIALFFATCLYDSATDSYRPMNEDDIKKFPYGVLFHTPDWQIDFFQPQPCTLLLNKLRNRNIDTIRIDNGDMDGVAFQIGLQPLMRCHHQSGYIYPMAIDAPLQDNWHFEKIYFKHSVALSKKIYNMMDGGKKVFPYEGITDAKKILDKMKSSFLFSKEDVKLVYDWETVDHTVYPTFNSFKEGVLGFSFDGESLKIQEDEVDYNIPQDMLNRINSQYDKKIC